MDDMTAPHNPLKSYAWGCASQLNIIADAKDPELWGIFLQMLVDRGIYDEVMRRLHHIDLEPVEG
jgi:hypothetical protein